MENCTLISTLINGYDSIGLAILDKL